MLILLTRAWIAVHHRSCRVCSVCNVRRCLAADFSLLRRPPLAHFMPCWISLHCVRFGPSRIGDRLLAREGSTLRSARLSGQANATHSPTHTRRDGNLRARACPDPWAPAATPIDARVPELARNATLCRCYLACKETRLAAQCACFSWVHRPTLASLVRASLPRACAVCSMRKAQGLSPLAVVGAVRWKTGAEDSHPRVCGPGFALHMPLRWPPRQSDGARRRGLTSLERCRWRRIQIRAAAS